MPSENHAPSGRGEFNITLASTVQHLLAVGLACAGLWSIIALTLNG